MVRFFKILLPAVCLSLLSCSRQQDDVSDIVSGHVIHFTEPPQVIPAQCSVDAPLLGNGYTGVALSGTPDNFVFRPAR